MNNKKITILFIITATIALLGIVGFTVAYFTSSTDFDNEFYTAVFQTKAAETFTSPENWMPGDTTPKTLTVKNEGNVDVKARVCLSEEWTSNNDESLPLIFDDVRMALINFDNTSDWTKDCNCYEYNDVLEPGDETSSFISGVTFNPDATADIECTTTTTNGTTKKTCSSTGEGYDNATYKLKLTVETVQANKANLIWNETYALVKNNLTFVNRQVSNEFTVGDEVVIGSEHFYVIKSDSDKLTLLAKYNLLVGEVFDYVYDYSNDSETFTYIKTLSNSDDGYGLQNVSANYEITNGSNQDILSFNGVVGFSGSDYWDDGNLNILSEYSQNGEQYYSFPPPYVYRSNIGNGIAPNTTYTNNSPYVQDNDYTIAYFVENYINTLKSLSPINSILGRLLSLEEAVDLGCDELLWECSSINSNNQPTNGTAPSWLYNTSYWLGSVSDPYGGVFYMNNGSIISFDHNYPASGVRPVIEIPLKSNDICTLPDNYSNYKYTVNMFTYSTGQGYVVTIGNPLPTNVSNYESLSVVEWETNEYEPPEDIYFALKHRLKNNIVTDSYIEFIITDDMVNNGKAANAGTYILRYTTDSNNIDDIYEINKQTMIDAFGTSNCVTNYDYGNGNTYNVFVCGGNPNEIVYISESGEVRASQGATSTNYICKIDRLYGAYCYVIQGVN